MMGAVCSFCPGGPVMASRPGASPAAQVVGMNGVEVLPAIAERPDVHWCLACWKQSHLMCDGAEAAHG